MKKVKLNTSKLRIKKETIANLSADMQTVILGGGVTDTVQNTINDLYCNPANTYAQDCAWSWDNNCGGGGGGGTLNPPTAACGVPKTHFAPCGKPSLKECLPINFTTVCLPSGSCMM